MKTIKIKRLKEKGKEYNVFWFQPFLKFQKWAYINKKPYKTRHCRREKELTVPKLENFLKEAH